MSIAIKLAEQGILPDPLIRLGIRKLLKERIAQIRSENLSSDEWVTRLKDSSIAVDTDSANDQHYELPAEYFVQALGPHLKYSCGYWEKDTSTLAESEEAMLKLSVERADLANGQAILELGCGWGSLSLYMAKCFPESKITAVSNSRSQKSYIDEQARLRGLTNLEVVTADINDLKPNRTFDRIVSVEMFEHVRNHHSLFERLSGWLEDDGKVFVHVFTHKQFSYLFEAQSSKDWMSRYFFTGGIMPAVDLLPTAAKDTFKVEKQWSVNGLHYSKTLEAWLVRHDADRKRTDAILKTCYGSNQAKLWSQRWRIFYLACSELFAFDGGKEWPVTHYLFSKR